MKTRNVLKILENRRKKDPELEALYQEELKSFKKEIICVGCGVDSQKAGYDNENDLVIEHGSYFNGKFVCDECYGILINIGQDVGSAYELQQKIQDYFKRVDLKDVL